MEEIINQAYIALTSDDFRAFTDAARVPSMGTCLRIVVNNLNEALELLKENAIKDQCDPVVVKHYANSYKLHTMLNEFIRDDK